MKVDLQKLEALSGQENPNFGELKTLTRQYRVYLDHKTGLGQRCSRFFKKMFGKSVHWQEAKEQTLRAAVEKAEKRLQDAGSRVQFHEQWLAYDLPAATLTHYPEAVDTLFNAALIKPAIAFNGLRVAEDGKPEIRQGDQWVEVTPLEPKKGWFFTAHEGLVERDRRGYEKLWSCAQLQPKELQAVRVSAESGEDKPCVLQVFTSEPTSPHHTSHSVLRVIDAEGFVFSFGFKAESEGRPFSTCEGGFECVDEEEFAPFSARFVTSVPLGEDEAKDILSYVEGVRRLGDTAKSYDKARKPVRYHALKQNSTKATRILLAKAGVEVKTERTVASLFAPNIFRWPVVGTAVQGLSCAVKWVAEKTPDVVKTIFRWLSHFVLFIPRLLVTFITNSVLFARGGAKSTPPIKGTPCDDIDRSDALIYFPKLLNGWGDFFSSGRTIHDHSLNLLQWQLAQFSTEIFIGDGKPHFTVVPPAEKVNREPYVARFLRPFTPPNEAL